VLLELQAFCAMSIQPLQEEQNDVWIFVQADLRLEVQV